MMIRRSTFIAAALSMATAAQGQSIFDASARAAPQWVSYQLGTPTNIDISQVSVPIFVLVPIREWLSMDVGSAYASTTVERTLGDQRTTSTISGLTDTQVRLNATMGTDFLAFTAGVNLPTGRSYAKLPEQQAATLIGSDFLAFPISNMGTGFGGTGGVAFARPFGTWNFGAGFSARRSQAYEPFEQSDGESMRYEPGDEYRVRVGVDHPWGTGQVQAGLTYSRFGDDTLSGGFAYNTGDRYLTQVLLANSVGRGDLTVTAWNLYRTGGSLADGSISRRENISNVLLGYAIPAGGARVEPTLETRAWTQVDLPTSVLTNVGVRIESRLGPMAVTPSVGYSVGRIAAQNEAGESVTAAISGFRGALVVRLW